MKGYHQSLFFLCIVFILWGSCKTSEETSEEFTVNIRLPSEPEGLNPMLSKSSYGVQILGWIMPPAAEFDPLTMQLSPLLITELPREENVTEGKHSGRKLYKLHFRPEATWDNGQPIAGSDYLFTVKAAFNPYVSATGWRGFLTNLKEIELSTSDPKMVTIYVDSSYFLAMETITNWNIYPAHVYDPSGIMEKFALDELRDPQHKWTPQQDSLLKNFAEAFQSSRYLRDQVEGAGPYKLESWTTGEFIRLTRKENWWGDQLSDPPLLLQAYPQSLTYHIIGDAATAEAALKSGQIDVLSEVPPASFVQMKDDPQWKDKFQFEAPALMQIYYLELNNRDPILSDRNIRKALAYAIDYDGIMENVLKGLGQRTIGPIPPQRSYYHKGLQPVEQDINKSLALIKEAGWEDTNGNGIADKVINGKREELQVEMKITNKEEGQVIANIVKENAMKAGINVEIEVLDASQFNQDVRQFNFDIVPLRVRPLPSIDEPYQMWHSASDQAGGGNRSGFHNADADAAIMEIRTAASDAERDSSYYELQEIIYEEQPAIFLYVPLERIAVSKKFRIVSSSRKPGYFENLFRPADNQPAQ